MKDIALSQTQKPLYTKFVEFTNLINSTTNNFSVGMSLNFSVVEEERGDGNCTLLSTRFEPQLYEFEFTSRYRVDKYLDSLTTEPSPDTIIGCIMNLLMEHGWSRKEPWLPQPQDRKKEYIEPIPQSPSIHYHRLYNMIGYNASEIEQFV